MHYYKRIYPTSHSMEKVSIVPRENMGRNFIPPEYLPKEKDEYFQRNKQTTPPKSGWRHLKGDEVEKLVQGGSARVQR